MLIKQICSNKNFAVYIELKKEINNELKVMGTHTHNRVT
jgi:hypothetical protein